MSWKSILVHVKSHEDWSPSIDVAVGLAESFDAKLTGLYTDRGLAMLKLMFGADHKAVHDAEARDAPLVAEAEARFRRACAAAAIDAEWDYAEGNAQEVLNLAGRCHDLLVVEQSPSGLDGTGTDMVEECAISCGTPTLIVPKTGRFDTVGKRIVVAWNHSRQSAAALHAAMPLIARADKVILLMGKERDQLSSVTRRPKHDVAAFLRRHNGEVDVVPFEANDADAGLKILSSARGARSDMLVMGAYGRSAWREFLLGGATRHVTSYLDIPVLMAH